VHRLANGAILVDDSYNASPAAVAAMLELLAETPGRKVAVLGEMLELGEQAEQFHRETGKLARQACEQLLAVGGENARALAEAFGPGAQWVEDVAAAIPRCGDLLEGGEVVLVKGSRGIGLDRLVAALLEEGR
jgi:UDP-N-acetylmuramoyl-tripeptide--D-alanyl-D-alanine ligase